MVDISRLNLETLLALVVVARIVSGIVTPKLLIVSFVGGTENSVRNNIHVKVRTVENIDLTLKTV